jgi:hypothetical protein
MKVGTDGLPVDALISSVKDAVKLAGVSLSTNSRDLRVDSVQVILQALASKTAGGTLEFNIPFIGMTLRAGARVTAQDTHTIDMTLRPPDQLTTRVVRGANVEEALVEAITTIRTTMALATAGEDPWTLSAGVVEVSFGITKAGTISVGVDGELANEVRHTLRLTLKPCLVEAPEEGSSPPS